MLRIRVRRLLYGCHRTTICVSSYYYVSSSYYISSVLILLNMCPHTTILSSYYCMFPHTTICFIVLLCVPVQCFLILGCMCSHTQVNDDNAHAAFMLVRELKASYTSNSMRVRDVCARMLGMLTYAHVYTQVNGTPVPALSTDSKEVLLLCVLILLLCVLILLPCVLILYIRLYSCVHILLCVLILQYI